MLAIKRIVHPTDFSTGSEAAFELACSLARDYGATLVVCHVVPPPSAVIEGVVITIPVSEQAEARNRLSCVRASDRLINVVHRLETGDPAHEILRVAEEDHADLIVMGTHGRGGLSRLLMGSVAEAVMRKAPCPVITVRTARTAEAKVEAAAAS